MLRQHAGRFFCDPRTRCLRQGKGKWHLRFIHSGYGRSYGPQIVWGRANWDQHEVSGP